MRCKNLFQLSAIATFLAVTSCSPKYSANPIESVSIFEKDLKSKAHYDMVLDAPITYTIDVSTPSGRIKLHNLTKAEAEKVVLTEAIMAYNCNSIVEPKYTYLVKNGKILRITVQGNPARYKTEQQ